DTRRHPRLGGGGRLPPRRAWYLCRLAVPAWPCCYLLRADSPERRTAIVGDLAGRRAGGRLADGVRRLRQLDTAAVADRWWWLAVGPLRCDKGPEADERRQ